MNMFVRRRRYWTMILFWSTIMTRRRFFYIINSSNGHGCQSQAFAFQTTHATKLIKLDPFLLHRNAAPSTGLHHYYYANHNSHVLLYAQQQQKKKKEKNENNNANDDDKYNRNLTNKNDNDDDNDNNILSSLPLILPLLSVYISNQWSRSSIYYLVNFSSTSTSTTEIMNNNNNNSENAIQSVASAFTAMNIDLQFSQAQYGILASIGFTALFAIASLFAGNLADKYDRKLLTVGSTLSWTLATFLTAISTSYEQVLAARIFMGLACAFAVPSGITLLKDNVNKAQSSLVTSIYGSGIYLGGALSSLSILLDETLGWRSALFIIAAFGLFSATTSTLFLPSDQKKEEKDSLSISTLSPPSNQKSSTSSSASSSSSFMNSNNQETNSPLTNNDDSLLADAISVLSTRRVQYLFLASFARFSSGLMIGIWSAPYYRLAFPQDATSYALINAIIVALCGGTSAILGGYLADQFASTTTSNNNNSNSAQESEEQVNDDDNAMKQRLLVPIIGSILAIPSWYFTIHANTFAQSMTWLAIEYLVAESWFGPSIAVLQSTVPPGKGGTAQGMFTLTGALGNFAPSLLGILYAQSQSLSSSLPSNSILPLPNGDDPASTLSYLLGTAVCSGYLLSAIFFFLSANATVDNENEQYKDVTNATKRNSS
mmetsp:Transcript_18948/g.26673  ORF Transcript_18948/g.26673 Transcript_18948/m.26673 type:complete len:658 (+) Transcript_18948:38-2011(+)